MTKISTSSSGRGWTAARLEGYALNMRFRCLFAFLFVVGCARAPIKTPDQSMRLLDKIPDSLADDMGVPSLVSALEANVKFLKEKQKPEDVLYFGPRQMAKSEYIRALDYLIAEGKADASGARFQQALRLNFEAYEVYGQEEWGQVFITSYFEPVIEG
jgi:hypothetical protein